MSNVHPVEAVYKGECYVAVYGAGYVGLGLAAVLLRKGLKVILVDIDEEKLNDIGKGKFTYVERAVVEAIGDGLAKRRLELTSSGVEASRRSCVKIVTVPVHLDWVSKGIDYGALTNCLENIAAGLKRGDLVIIESSIPPGTTSGLVKSILEERSGLRVEEDFYLAYSPERVYVGRVVKDIEENYPKIVGGIGPKSLEVASRFYEGICAKGVVKMSSTTAAEFEKLVEGIYRDVNIALANELALACMFLGLDYYEIMEAANTQPYCHLHLPGPGVGGACIPIYPYFVLHKLVEKGFNATLVKTARKMNENMPWLVMRIIDHLYLKDKNPGELKVAVLGAAFRGDVDDVRLSPTHDLVSLLKARGVGNIVVHDPLVKKDPYLAKLKVGLTQSLAEALDRAGLVLVATRHSAYIGLRVSEVVGYSRGEPFIFDAVNCLVNDINYPKLIKLGVSFITGLTLL